MKKLLFIVLALASNVFFAQEQLTPARFPTEIKEVPERYEGKDAFGWQYTIANNTFRKQKDKILLEYKNLSLGDIYRSDLQNPLQIVLFYRKFNTVVLLDNQLNETARIDFNQYTEPLIAEAAGLATQNRLWIFDAVTQRLGLYDPARASFTPITPPFTEPLKYYQTEYNYFYWIDATGKCYAANLFGKVNLLGTVPHYDQVQVISAKQVIIKQGNSLIIHNFDTGKNTSITLVENSFRSFHYAAQILSIFTETEINQYKITLPE